MQTTTRKQDAELEPKRSSARILQHELSEAYEALNRSAHRLFLSGLSAGLDLGFSFLLIAIARTMAEGHWQGPAYELLLACMYSFGFVIVVLGRTELFTEQTTLAVISLLSGDVSFRMVARLWAIVFPANLLGVASFAGLVVLIGPALGVIDGRVFVEMQTATVSHPAWVIFCSGILAGWLMGLLSWLVAAGRDTISQIVIVWLIASAIGLAHLHHAILGTAEVLGGVFWQGGKGFGDYCHFLLWVTLGNAFGGPFFVALLRYGQSRPSTREK